LLFLFLAWPDAPRHAQGAIQFLLAVAGIIMAVAAA
jgi:hypothetical protein